VSSKSPTEPIQYGSDGYKSQVCFRQFVIPGGDPAVDFDATEKVFNDMTMLRQLLAIGQFD
jgi:hypothetical protein